MQLSVSTVAAIGASLWMCIAADSPTVLIVGTCVFGLAMAPGYASCLSLARQYVLLTGKAMAVINIVGGVGAMILPIVYAQLLEHVGPRTFMVLTATLSVTLGACYLGMGAVGKGTAMARAKGGDVDLAGGAVFPGSRADADGGAVGIDSGRGRSGVDGKIKLAGDGVVAAEEEPAPDESTGLLKGKSPRHKY
jgi:MFS family permease